MDSGTITRRRFVGTATAAASALFSNFGLRAAERAVVRIEEPFHGAVLNRRHSLSRDGGLAITVRGTAPVGQPVLINGVPARRDGPWFETELVLRDHESEINACLANDDRTRHSVRVVWDRLSRPRYRFAIDDNGFFLRDIWKNSYGSLFDCRYLAMLRDLHRKYGTKFVLNIYYTTGDEFDLSKFPNRYRAEWRDNAHWLKLAFHAHADQPPKPYYDAPPEVLIADFDKVAEQIHRFAGEEAYSPTTIVHWGVVRPTAWKPLADRGVKVLSGYFERSGDQWVVNYRMDAERSEYLSRHDALKDFASGIVFSKIDMVCNNVPLAEVVPALERVAQDTNRAEILDLMTHEQYFWPFYDNYLPDHAQRVEAAIRWAAEHEYRPVFLHEGFLGLND